MERPSRIMLTFAPPIGIAMLGASLLAATIAGAPHPALRALVVFVVAFPLLWIALATTLSYTTARALRKADVEVPSRTRAMGTFRWVRTLAHRGHPFPATRVVNNTSFSTAGLVIHA